MCNNTEALNDMKSTYVFVVFLLLTITSTTASIITIIVINNYNYYYFLVVPSVVKIIHEGKTPSKTKNYFSISSITIIIVKMRRGA